MNNKILLAMAVAASSSLAALSQGEARLLRFPATNGHEVAFSYAGDIYTVPVTGGTARRLTSHKGYEAFARFSPDGRQLAFTGQYDGNTEVYVMPAAGGEPRRVTVTASNPRDDWGDRMGPNNITMTWTPDGRGIVYRNRTGDGFVGRLWVAPLDGGMPEALPLPEGGFCSYSPDGKRLAYNRVFREFRTWKYYRGGMADDIWIWDKEAGKVTQVTDNVAQDICPMWIGDEIYFISDRDMRMNIFCYNTVSGTTTKVTDYDDYDVKFPSCGGGMIVYEHGGWLYTLDPVTKQSRKVTVMLDGENLQARTERRQVSDQLTSASLNADGTRLAVTARGDVFTVPATPGVTRNLTRSSGVHDREAKYSPDGKQIAYISDATGETELWLRPADGSAEPRQLTTAGDTYIRDFAWSPKGDRLVTVDRKNRITLVDAASGARRVLLTDSLDEPPVPAFSPDGRWIAYSRLHRNMHSVVCLMELATGRETAVTDDWYDSNSPAFSTDGKYLIFASGRDFNPTYSEIEWNFSYQNMEGVYMVMLAADTPSPLLPRDGEPAAPAPADQGKDKGKAAKDKKADEPVTRIDLDGIAARVVKLPVGAGHHGNFHCDGSNLWYSHSGSLHRFDLAMAKDEKLEDGVRIAAVSGDGKKALLARGGAQLFVTDMPHGSTDLSSPVDLGGMIATVNYGEEWKQIFDEAWRAYRDGFYLENMHGVDWQAIHDKYAVLVPHVKCRLDLTYVIGGMISELAVGHAYVDGGDHPDIGVIKTGMLGARLSRQGNAFRIDHILPGAPDREALRSPLAEVGLGITEGMFITAVDGIDLSGVSNIYTLLLGKAGVPTELTIATDANGSGARRVVVKPIRDEYPLEHYEWVQRNIARVAERTGGRVGYIYIPDMGPEGLREFARYYYAQIDKEALIIDDRGNGGGNISPMVIERLLRKPYRMTMHRGSTLNEIVPDATVYGPKVLLVNKYSASDGDLFPWSFKENNIGTVIGTRSWGGIIGITSSLPYIDGTDIRVPFFTNYSTRGEWIVENHGVDPDIVVDNDPVREAADEDQQLDRAIDIILDQLKDRRPLPSTPAPRTLRDLGL